MKNLQRVGISAVVVALFLLTNYPQSQAQEHDRVTGLAMDAGWELVQANCTECHSAQLIIQNSGSRAVWKSRITWMQQTQGLHVLEAEVEASILSYLEINYGPKEASRRANLAPQFLPDNPYPTVDQDGQ
ncbi:MAG: hypothetical protein O2971_12240 [Proteobacteria bacterium]|nr:hypothetical protein [Pseudomonadota bacterium]